MLLLVNYKLNLCVLRAFASLREKNPIISNQLKQQIRAGSCMFVVKNILFLCATPCTLWLKFLTSPSAPPRLREISSPITPKKGVQ